MRMAQRLKFISDNPGEETRMPATRPIEKRLTMTPEQINLLIRGHRGSARLVPHVHRFVFALPRTSETFGLQWKSYGGDSLMIHSTAY